MEGLRPVGITGVGSYTPEGKVTNQDLEKLVDTTDEWITSRTGIKVRQKASDQEVTSDLAVIAAKKALDVAGAKPEEIDLIILATITPDMYVPATACVIQHKLGCKRAAAFDINAGCTGFAYGLAMASGLVGCKKYNKVLVIGYETLSKIVDWTDRNTCILFGDGGGAAVVEPVEEGYGILFDLLGADGSDASLIEVPGGGSCNPASLETVEQKMHYIKMKGSEVFKFAVNAVSQAISDMAEKSGLSMDEINLIIPHQANDRILESAARKLKMPKEKFYTNLENYGNTSAGSIPLALDEALQKGLIKKGDNIFLVGFGAGMTWGGVAMKWAYDPKS
jgi:3-oxoacyl-[acyl-carrier-protein] synthase III